MKRRAFLKAVSIAPFASLLSKKRPEPKLEPYDISKSVFQWVRIPVSDGETLTLSNGETTSIYQYHQPHCIKPGRLVFIRGFSKK